MSICLLQELNRVIRVTLPFDRLFYAKNIESPNLVPQTKLTKAHFLQIPQFRLRIGCRDSVD